MGIDPKKAAIAIGINPDTMFKHYVAMDEQEVTDDVFAKLTPTLRPHTTTTGTAPPTGAEPQEPAGG
jgi:hypothetical protein